MENYHFSGYATRNDLLCGDGRTIRRNAFKDCDGTTVPLVWNHDHSKPGAVLGHALLENRDDGVYAYCTLNDTEEGKEAQELVRHGDIRCLSIFANKLKQVGNDVIHGMIRELSLVLAGANPGAYIDFVVEHSDDDGDSAYINYDENAIVVLQHAEANTEEGEKPMETEKTVQDVLDELTEEQLNVVNALIGEALNLQSEENEDENLKQTDIDEGDVNNTMKYNVFEGEQQETKNTLSHSEEAAIIADAKRYGSMKDSYLAHADEGTEIPYGIDNMNFLFPDFQSLNPIPEFIKRQPDAWVDVVMNGVHHTPFSRIKSIFADITEDDARAKGYIKGKYKKEEVFSLLKRTTSPTTIYKKQKFDKDDLSDVTTMDVVGWIKREMRMMLDEEIARAILIGDQRLASSDDHINTDNIRPILNDADLFVIRWKVNGADSAALAKNFITAAIKSRKNYRGSGNPVLYTTEDMLTEMLLLEDTIGHRLYKTDAELATALRVSKIVTVSAMEDITDKDGKNVYGIIVNLNDYNVGADKGGAVNMFDDFDIDYNQQKYLIETRCSGALVKPFSAIVLRSGNATASEEPTIAEATAPYKQ